MKLYIVGKSGKMGQTLERLISQDPAFSLSSEPPDAVIDFSAPAALSETLNFKKPAVIGTTGYSRKEFEKIKKAAENFPVFYSANFSLGIAVLKKLIKIAAAYLKESDIDIIELHHTKKKDSPSGTALSIAAELKKKPSLHSIRAGQIIGEHMVLFNFGYESLEIKHRALKRDVFAKGALMAAQFIYKKQKGLYSFNDLLEGIFPCKT